MQYLKSIFLFLIYKKCLQTAFYFLTTAVKYFIVLFYRSTGSVSFMLLPAEQIIKLISLTFSLSDGKNSWWYFFCFVRLPDQGKLRILQNYMVQRLRIFLLNIFNLLVLPFVFIESVLCRCFDASLFPFVFSSFKTNILLYIC